jgi:large subunit ribosomal protein L29
MRADDLRDLSREELDAKAGDLREQLLKLRFQQSTGQIENAQMLRGVRKDIARVLTIRREKEIAAATAPAGSDAAHEAPQATESDS